MSGTQDLAAQMPFNANKPLEYDPDAAFSPPAGAFSAPDDPIEIACCHPARCVKIVQLLLCS